MGKSLVSCFFDSQCIHGGAKAAQNNRPFNGRSVSEQMSLFSYPYFTKQC